MQENLQSILPENLSIWGQKCLSHCVTVAWTCWKKRKRKRAEHSACGHFKIRFLLNVYLQGRILQAYKLAKCANGNIPLINTHGQASVHSNQRSDEGVRSYKEPLLNDWLKITSRAPSFLVTSHPRKSLKLI